ncbi:hypothetical protein [Listeria costaricensis]|uniref:hypothetical protein n=1 Tax=Listeria costaricensis TaxID=2026604 RepID=UPI000C084E4F|nr:hypothetical protein [Listeria costaricensis]
MKRKKFWLILVLCPLLILGGYFGYKYAEKQKTPTMLHVASSNYALTDEPSDLDPASLNFAGKTTKKINRYETPSRNLTSNFLPKGTKIYTGDDENISYYKKDDQFFVARLIYYEKNGQLFTMNPDTN